jgi:hypothetical protein
MKFSGRFMQAAVDAGSALGKTKRSAINPATLRRIASARPAVRAAESIAPRAAQSSGVIEAVLPLAKEMDVIEKPIATQTVASAAKTIAQPRVVTPNLPGGRRDIRC